MIRKIHTVLPHILFALLVILLISPSLESVQSFVPMLVIVIIIEVAIVIKRKSLVANDIGIIVFGFLSVWEYITSKVGVKNTMLYPSPENVFGIIVKDYEKVIEGVFSSLQLLFIAFGIAIVLGVGLGLFVGLSDRLSGTVLPIVRVISPIPPIIYSPYAVALLPTFRTASIFVVTLTIFWSLFMSMVLSTREIDKKIMDSARTLNLSKKSMILNVVLPYSLPGLINSVSVSVSTSFLVLTAAEMIGSNAGLGWYVKYNSDFANYTKVVFGIVMIGVVITLLNALVSVIRKVLIRWR